MTTATAPKVDQFVFKCAGCNAAHQIPAYAIAQCAMGHTLTHTCDCGQRHHVQGKERGRQGYDVRAIG